MNRINKHDYYLTIAQAVSLRSTCLKRHYGCVIVKDDEIIATGYNGSPRGKANCCDIYDTCPRINVEHNSGNYAGCNAVHAEQNALISASRKDLLGATLYLAGYDYVPATKEWQPIANCEPCPICANMIANAGIDTVIGKFTTPTANTHMVQQTRTYHRELSDKRREFIKSILPMNGEQLYAKYGMKRDETITETICLPDNYEMDIKCVMPDEELATPWTEAVLFHHGQEVTHTEPKDNFFGEWTLSDNNQTFTVVIK